MSATFTEIVTRAVIHRDGQLLVARQRTKPWSFLPGGHVEPGEQVEVALIRELGEELGTEATIAGFVGAVEHGYIEDGTTHHEINLVFEVAITARDPISQEEHLEFEWLRLDQLAKADFRPSSLKNALVAAGNDQTPFWHGWNGHANPGSDRRDLLCAEPTADHWRSGGRFPLRWRDTPVCVLQLSRVDSDVGLAATARLQRNPTTCAVLLLLADRCLSADQAPTRSTPIVRAGREMVISNPRRTPAITESSLTAQ